MKISEIRIYAECLEQGLDFKEYFLTIDKNCSIKNIYPTKARGNIANTHSILEKITRLKDFDLIITCIIESQEIPVLLVEYSTAVPTDDHKMQRSDVYFFASMFKIPVLKISPFSKGSNTSHGGGDKISFLQEINIALQDNGIVYFIDWKDQNTILLTQEYRLSCIPYNKDIEDILRNIVIKIKKHKSFKSAYEELLQEHKKQFFNKQEIENLKKIFVNSTRFQRNRNEITIKVNRLGHAMDPDRGILYFCSMLFGRQNNTTKIIIHRESKVGKESYKALFCGLSKNILEKLHILIEAKTMDSQKALEIFTTATGITLEFDKIDSIHYTISDKNLIKFLQTYSSITYKSIFFTTTRLKLCDYKHKVLCEISWNYRIVQQYLQSLHATSHNMPLILTPLSCANAKEDIITYASCLLLQKIGAKILSVSYPAAQGDRAIIIGQGRTTKRIYLDIIAYTDSQKVFVLLQENKERYNDLQEDAKKLNDIKTRYTPELHTLLQKLHFIESTKSNIMLGLGAKYPKKTRYLDVDYIFSFDISSHLLESKTIIFYTIAIINLDVMDTFKPLINKDNKLQGEIELELIYKA